MKRILKSLAGKCHENQFALQFLAYRDLVIASKKRPLLCRSFKFRFLYEKSRFHFLCCFCFKSEIRVSGILNKPSLGISNSKSLMSASIAENVSSEVACGRFVALSNFDFCIKSQGFTFCAVFALRQKPESQKFWTSHR